MPCIFLIYYQSASYIVIETLLYFSYLSLIISSKMPYLFLIVYRYIYIVVDTVLYLYTLPIDHSFYSFSILYLSCNLS